MSTERNKNMKKVDQKILDAIAPCSMFCSTCTGCQYGEISYHAKELLKLLAGHEEFLDKNLKSPYRDRLEEYRIFQKRLRKFAYPKCGGCRNGRAEGCSIKNCIIPSCTKKHHVLFCGLCEEFPCQQVNEKIYKKTTIAKWLRGNQDIKENGVCSYYEKHKDIPHYIDYVK